MRLGCRSTARAHDTGLLEPCELPARRVLLGCPLTHVPPNVLQVGYGDLHPSTSMSRAFTCFYILVGVTFVFASIAQAPHP